MMQNKLVGILLFALSGGAALAEITDGGFEAGPDSGAWLENSVSFGTPICTVADCFPSDGTGPFEGTYWAWFGGIPFTAEIASLEQTVTIASNAESLSFYLQIPAFADDDAFLDVSIDGGVVFSTNDIDIAQFSEYRQVDIDLSGFADGIEHILRFDSTSGTNGTSSFYIDNVAISSGGSDTDGDGVDDAIDNCTLVANSDQRDSNGDGFGNICDADLNNDNIVNPSDLGLFRLVFFSNDADADFNGDGVVNPTDLGVLRLSFFAAPGPSGQAR